MADLDPVLRQKLLDAYNGGDLTALNSLLNSGVQTVAPAQLQNAAPELATPAVQTNSPAQLSNAASTAATPAATPLFFDPNEGQQPSAPQPQFFDPNAGQQPASATPAVPQQPAEQPSLLERVLGPARSGDVANSPGAAALESFADSATLGLSPKAEAFLASKIYGVPYERAMQAVEERNTQLQAQHPYASVAGSLGGIVGGAVGMTPAVDALGLAARAGHPIANVLKAAGLGAGIGGAESALHGGDARENALAAVTGGIAGPIAGKIAGTVVNRLGRASERGWRILASKMEGVTPDDLKAWYAREAAAHPGVKPNMASMMNAHARGEIQGLAQQNPAMRGALVDEARAAAQKGTATQEMKRAADMTAGMDNIGRDTPVAIPQALKEDADIAPAVADALKGYKYRAVRKRWADGAQTLDDIDTIRQRLGAVSSKPGDEFAQARDAILDFAPDEYKDLVGNYRRASNEIAGLSHGQAGGTEANMPADLQRRIATPEAQEGLGAGQQQFHNAKGLSDASGGIGKSFDDKGFENMVAGVAETAGGSHVFGLRNAVRGVAGILKGERLPRATQLQLAKALATTDAKQFEGVIDNLIHANVSLDKIRALQSAFSAYTGSGAGRFFSGGE
jgi:hypothetical protein